jgi:hypothetical protein
MAQQESQREKDENDELRRQEQEHRQLEQEHQREQERTRAGESTTSPTSTGTSQTSTNGPKDRQGSSTPTSESHPTPGHPTFPGDPALSAQRTAAARSGEQIEKPDEKLDPKTGDMLVDPRPTAPPIVQGNAEYVFPPAPASSDDVLALEPNRYEDAVNGPDPQISAITYTHWTAPDGRDFVAPLSTAEVYERKGYQRGEDEDIPDFVAYARELAKSDQERERDEISKKRIEQHDKDRRELLKQQDDRRREQARAR